jgi:branched-chain amino acid transport system substrate-binding protein
MKTFMRWGLILASALPVALIDSALVGGAAGAEDCQVKIGMVGPMTGGAATYGLAEKAATEFEAAWTNANGGLHVGAHNCKVSVVSFDSQATAAGGAAGSNYMASQGVFAIIGPIPSPEVTGFKPVAKRHNQVNMSSSFAADVIGPNFPLAFNLTTPPPVWGTQVIKDAKDHYKMQSVIVVGPNDQGGTDAGAALIKAYTEDGIKASPEWYQRGTPNFAPIVARLMSSDPGAIELGPMGPGEAGILAKQLIEAGYAGVLGRTGAGGNEIIKSVGGVSKLKALYYFDHVPLQDPGIARCNADFQRLMKAAVPENTLFYTAQIGAELLLKAISLAGTDQDGEKIAAELRKMTPESRYLGKGGWRGKKQYGINQMLVFPGGLTFITNGKSRMRELRIEVASES